jgi:dipeptidyl aminopeptidase/acylaminoacyl peptidase
MLICHGTADERIPFETTRRFVEAYGEGKVEFHGFEGASHSFRPETVFRPKLANVICAWFDGQRQKEDG